MAGRHHARARERSPAAPPPRCCRASKAPAAAPPAASGGTYACACSCACCCTLLIRNSLAQALVASRSPLRRRHLYAWPVAPAADACRHGAVHPVRQAPPLLPSLQPRGGRLGGFRPPKCPGKRPCHQCLLRRCCCCQCARLCGLPDEACTAADAWHCHQRVGGGAASLQHTCRGACALENAAEELILTAAASPRS